MQNLHLKLTSKYPRYHSWHHTKHHNKIHWGVLIGFALIASLLILNSNNQINAQADTIPPLTPTNLTATAISSSQLNLSWTASGDNAGVTGYKIYRCAGSACAPTTQIATSATNSYSDTGLTASTTYIYAVSAYDVTGNESGKSTSASVTTDSQTQTWQQTLEQNFDIADTFDNYNDWRGDALFTCKYQEDNVNNLFKYLDGSPGKWGKYCYYEGYDGLPPYAIKDHGTGKRVTGKSARLSHPGNGLDKGELGLLTMFFGEHGNEFSGYNEVYIFFRMNLPHNAFPTYDSPGDSGNVAYDQTSPPVVQHIDGYTYYPIASWKWFNINTGWRSAKCFSNIEKCPPPDNNNCRYGNNEVHLHLKTGKSQNYQQTFQLAVHNTASKVIFWGIPGIIIFDQLVGIELYYKLESSLGANDGLFKAWVYDTSGKATLAADVGGISYRPSPSMGCYQEARTENHKFNRIAIESNKHVSGYPFNCGTGMDCAWYLDDLIIDDQRIGTIYFNLLSKTTPPPDTQVPTNPTNLTTTAISSSQINLSWTASTDNVGVTGYKIYRCAGSACAPTTQIATSANNSYSNTGLTASTAYTYVVSAYDAAGNESGKSTSVSATTQAASSVPIPAWLAPNSPLALNLHPRLLFIPQSYKDAHPNAQGFTIEEMRTKLTTDYKTEFQLFINTLDGHFSDDIAAKTRLYMTYDAMNYAFLYLVDPISLSPIFTFGHTRDEYGNKAKAHALQIAQNAIATPFTISEAGWNDQGYDWVTSSNGGPINMPMALVYDWVYPLLTKVEKQTIADGVINTFDERILNVGPYVNSRDHGVTQNGNYGALAIWGDSIDNPGSTYYSDKMQTILDSVKYDWLERFYEFMNYVFEGSAAWPEATGGGYNLMASVNIPFFTGAVSTAIGKDYFYQTTYFRYHPLYFLSNIRPLYDGIYHWYRTDDMGDGSVSEWENQARPFHTLVGSLAKSAPDMASLTKWMIDKSFLKRGRSFGTDDQSIRIYYLLYNFVWGDKTVIGKSPTQLNIPLSNKLGLGQYVMRTGYESPSDTMIVLNAPKFHPPVSHANWGDFASFTIEKYGNLAINGSKSKGFPGQNIDITKNPMFYNTVGVYKPGELIREGTQYYNVMGYRPSYDNTANFITDFAFQDNGTNHVGSVIAENLNAGSYDYINYDYTRSWYNSQTTNDSTKFKVDFANREFVYLRSAGGLNDEYVVVFDRINSVDPSYTKRWFLQTSFEPQAQGGTWSVDSSRVGLSDPGKWNLNGSDTVKVTNTFNGSHGRLFSKTLLPTSFQISKVGGPGHYVEDAEGKVRYDGYDGKFTDYYKDFFGSFRVEVESKTGNKADQFLHVMQFGDSNTLTAMNNTTRIDADTMVGALIDDPTSPRIVLFSKDQTGASVSSAAYTANYSSTLTGKHLLADITPGTYDIYKNGAKILTGITSQTGKNTLAFESTGGSTFQIVKTGEAPPETDIQTPSTPANLTASAVSSSQINLSWTASTDNVGVTGYKIYRCAGSACAPTTQIATSATNSYSNTGLTASTAYTYTVSAYDAANNESIKSSSVSAATLASFKPSDLNKDGKVDSLDFEIFKLDFNRTDKPVSDFNQDGVVDSRDLGIMMSEWTR